MFDRIVIVDWSANATPKRGKDSIWIGEAVVGGDIGVGEAPVNLPTRAAAMEILQGRIAAALAAGERLLIGADFPFGYPTGFAQGLTGRGGALSVWEALATRIEDAPDNANNRFQAAAAINAMFPGTGPFWGAPATQELPGLPMRGTAREGHGLPEMRRVETKAKGAHTSWKLYTTGSVGSQALLGIARMQALRAAFPGQIAVWPFEDWANAPVVLAEVFPSLIAPIVAERMAEYPCKDAAQVDLLARALAGVDAGGGLGPMLHPEEAADILAEEGWILGACHAELLIRTLAQGQGPRTALTPPRLRNDCFAMPQGVSWVPVDEALAKLRAALHPVTGTETVAVAQAAGRVLAQVAVARRSNPPRANSAVDGYGFAHAALSGTGPYTLPLTTGRAAAGQPFEGAVPPGAAIRILTGAILPEGVDTVVLEEDCATDAARVAFDGPVKAAANTRRAGEDVIEGAVALPAGRRLRAPDLALLSALGLPRVEVFRPLRVGVVSTGDEIVADPGAEAAPHQIFDANRPMLLALAKGWGCVPVDLGHVRDNPRAIAARLDRGAARADVILTSGGASAGDEDHVSHLLRTKGTLSSWRIAMKPGRPLALAMWQGVPVFGLPGNPVAAFVCALIFARPALAVMGGGHWTAPQGVSVPAAFSKRKKAGRREYLRARLDDQGRAEVFASEGSGRISGLSWADGLVELPDEAVDIVPGAMVRFLPYAGFDV